MRPRMPFSRVGRPAQIDHGVLQREPGSHRGRTARGIRHVRTSRVVFRERFQRGARARDDPGDLQPSQTAGHHRTVVPRLRHARAVGARVRDARWKSWPATASTRCRRGDEYTPTPALSHAILKYNRGRTSGLADGIVITPSHNPPDSGGFKYNPPNGGPADTGITGWIENEANRLLAANLERCDERAVRKGARAATTHRHDYLGDYVADLGNVIDMDVIRGAKIRMGVDPLGGAGVHYWAAIAERYALDLTIVNESVDATFRFMTIDWDGRIRMDPSSPDAMQGSSGSRIASTSRSPATPTTTGTASSPAARACCRPITTSRCRSTIYSATGRAGARMRASARPWSAASIIDRVAQSSVAALRSAGRLQVVRRRNVRRLARLRRRGKRRRGVPAQGWHRLDDRQGRHRARAAVGGDHRAHRRDPGDAYRELTRELGEPLFDAWTHRRRRSRRNCWRSSRRRRSQSTELAGDEIQSI
jgi:phosphoglucomutase